MNTPFTIEALDPLEGTRPIFIREKRLLTLAKIGRSALLTARDLVPEVLEHPSVIFAGLRLDNDENKDRPEWLCYCGKPSFTYDKRGEKVPSDPNQVFLVFVDDQAIAYNWRWEFADERDRDLPKDFDNRFRKRVYDPRQKK